MAMRFRGDEGQVGGIEVIPFGVLTFVLATLLLANAWGAVDAQLAVTSAARESVRAFVEASDEATATAHAISAATTAVAAHGRDPSNTSVELQYPDGPTWARCRRVTSTVRHPIPALRIPVLGGFGHAFDVVSTQTEVIDPFRAGITGAKAC